MENKAAFADPAAVAPPGRRRRVCGWLAIAALVIRSVIPSGYMPEFSLHHGLPEIIFCNGMDDHAAPVGDHHDKAHHKGPCSFCINSIFASTGVAPVIFTPLLIGYTVHLAFADFRLARLRRFGNASSRSPPHFF